MKAHRPEIIDRLASEYVLGTLQGPARARFETLMELRGPYRAAVAAWENRLHGLSASVPKRTPSPRVWAAIEARTRPGHRQSRRQSRWSDLLSSLIRPAMGAALGVLAMVAVLQMAPESLVTIDQVAQHEQALPQSYVGLLLDGEGRPSLLISSIRHGTRVSVKSLRSIDAPAGKVLQVWALPKDGVAFPIGVATLAKAPGSTTFDLSDTSEALLSKVTQLAVTLEDAPVAANATPAEPFMLKGHCVKLW